MVTLEGSPAPEPWACSSSWSGTPLGHSGLVPPSQELKSGGGRWAKSGGGGWARGRGNPELSQYQFCFIPTGS